MSLFAPDDLETEDTYRRRNGPRCLALVNPRAGGLSTREYLAQMAHRDLLAPRDACTEPSGSACADWLQEMADHIGLDADFEVAPPLDRLRDYIHDAESRGFDTVVAVGGDGTVRAVAQHLVGSNLRLGIIPLGTANNVAHALGIPFNALPALKILAEGCERAMDVGRMRGEYFLESAGVGLFADAISAFGADELRRYQIHRMLKVVIPLLWNPRARRLQLTLDGRTHEEQAIMVCVSNAVYMGDGVPMAPDAGLDDGLFDVVIIRPMTRWELLRAGLLMMSGRHITLPTVRVERARTVEIRRVHRARHSLPVHVDDHILGYLPAIMEVVPGGLKVIAPRA